MKTTPCGARTRAGAPCKRQPIRCHDGRVRNGRCRNHGGMNYQKGGDPFAPSLTTARIEKAAAKARGDAFAAFMASPLDGALETAFMAALG